MNPSPTQQKTRFPSWTTAGLLILAIAGAFALRLVQLGVQSLWYDETVSVYLAGQPVVDLIGHTARDIHPPGYYLLLRGWLTVTGFPTGHAEPIGHRLEFMAAFLSLGFGVLLVPLAWRLACRLRLGRETALLASLLVAISPFAVWYSQEVRMYTLGACLGVLALLATTPYLGQSTRPFGRSALAYALTAAAGLYVLYYFAFLLLALNLLMIPLLAYRSTTGSNRWRVLAWWLAAQAGALLLYLPWLPVAWRQAVDPPVPPWRTAPQLTEALVEGWTALSLGQSADIRWLWPLLLLTAALILLAFLAEISRARRPSAHRQPAGNQAGLASVDVGDQRASLALLLVAAFGPGLLILLISPIAPLFHVRYLFTYWPAFAVLLALGLATLRRWRPPVGRWLAVASLVLLVAGSALSLQRLWTDSDLAADDHRRAVRELAQRWRPDDAILVNAGYAYPALVTYWPGPVDWRGRLTDYDPAAPGTSRDAQGSVILQTGHIDGDPGLGWGDPRSDFYALSAEAMRSKLEQVSQAHGRLWHYRIYDTVSDPEGLVRAELLDTWNRFDDQVYEGEANLRVQGYLSPAALQSGRTPQAAIIYDDWLGLSLPEDALATSIESGGHLELAGALWQRIGSATGQPVAVSLRLVDEAGRSWSARDELLGGNLLDLSNSPRIFQPLRLDIPAGTPPGIYQAVLVAYDPQTGDVLPVTAGSADGTGQAVVGQVQVQRPGQASERRPALTDFGPVSLVEATSPASTVSPGDAIPVSLLWQAASDPPSEALVVVVQLLDEDGGLVANLEEEPLQGRYASARWRPHELVQDYHQLEVPAGTAAGRYDLVVGLYRATDRQRLEARSGLLGWQASDHWTIRSLQVR